MWIIEAGRQKKKIGVLININFFKKKFGKFFLSKSLGPWKSDQNLHSYFKSVCKSQSSVIMSQNIVCNKLVFSNYWTLPVGSHVIYEHSHSSFDILVVPSLCREIWGSSWSIATPRWLGTNRKIFQLKQPGEIRQHHLQLLSLQGEVDPTLWIPQCWISASDREEICSIRA